ncbi:MAG: outer membrane protein transport protein [Duncaniella sp.]|nr:outer membrane protein transport protein [Duncaniella sp.]
MKKLLLAGLAACLPIGLFAQTAVDAMSVSQSELRGTARFMSMAGAFTALGGDISTLSQNPAGIGVYRSSDVSLTFGLDMLSANSNAAGNSYTTTQTKFNVNQFGFVGSTAHGAFNWGVSYNRVASFNRSFGGSLGELGSSYTNLVADYTTADGLPQDMLAPSKNYSPYWDSYGNFGYAPWSSALLYNSYAINPTSADAKAYVGLWDYDRTSGTGQYSIEERGQIDEYDINIGGNVADVVYWGIGVGITDLDYNQRAYYSEELSNANVPDYDGISYTDGSASWRLSNAKHISGTGVNLKFGLIFKPINEFRLGLAVHTPTWYSLDYDGAAQADYRYISPSYEQGKFYNGTAVTGTDGDNWYSDQFSWKLNSPWRLMVGAAGVIGTKGILSLDYEYKAYSAMRLKDQNGTEYPALTEDVKTYYRPTSTIRIGGEYRVTPAFSVRAGYSYETSPVTTEALDGNNGVTANYVYTSGPDDTETQPSYTFDRSTQYITLGLGYRYQRFYADLAYVHRYRQSDYHAYTDYNENVSPGYLVTAPVAKITDHNNQLVLTVGMRF